MQNDISIEERLKLVDAELKNKVFTEEELIVAIDRAILKHWKTLEEYDEAFLRHTIRKYKRLCDVPDNLRLEFLKRNFKGIRPTSIETRMKSLLEAVNIKYHRQYLVEDIWDAYYADFFLPEQNCIVEVDGIRWHNYPKYRRIDLRRTIQMEKKGYRVVRFWDFEVNSLTVEMLKDIILNNKSKDILPKSSKDKCPCCKRPL